MNRYLLIVGLTLILAQCSASSANPSSDVAPQSPVPTVSTATTTPTPDSLAVPERVSTTPFPAVALPDQPAANFAFSFSYGSCPVTRVVSTFDNTLMQSAQPDHNALPITVTLRLSDDERSEIYARMRSINLFGYPKIYTIPLPENAIRVYVTPHSTYYFILRNDTVLTTITWNDEIPRPTTTEADNLRELIMFLRTLIEARPEIEQLPPIIGGCD